MDVPARVLEFREDRSSDVSRREEGQGPATTSVLVTPLEGTLRLPCQDWGKAIPHSAAEHIAIGIACALTAVGGRAIGECLKLGRVLEGGHCLGSYGSSEAG